MSFLTNVHDVDFVINVLRIFQQQILWVSWAQSKSWKSSLSHINRKTCQFSGCSVEIFDKLISKSWLGTMPCSVNVEPDIWNLLQLNVGENLCWMTLLTIPRWKPERNCTTRLWLPTRWVANCQIIQVFFPFCVILMTSLCYFFIFFVGFFK